MQAGRTVLQEAVQRRNVMLQSRSRDRSNYLPRGRSNYLPWLEIPRGRRGDYCSPSETKGQCQISLSSNAMNDLVGAQLERRFSSLTLALQHGCNYVHRPLVASFFGPRFDKVMADVAEAAIGVGQGCSQRASACPMFSTADLGALLRGHSHSGRIAATSKEAHDEWRAFGNPETQIRGSPKTRPRHDLTLQDVFMQLRRRMRHPPPSWYAGTPAHHVHAVVHVRRGDLSTHTHWAALGRWWPEEYYKRILPPLFNALSARGMSFTLHVLSDGVGWDVAADSWKQRWWYHGLNPSTLRFHINGDYLETMSHIADADIVLLSQSTFSQTMANYNLGLIASDASGIRRANTAVRQGQFAWCGSFCDSGLRFGDQLRAFQLPAPPRCSCLGSKFLAHALHILSLNATSKDQLVSHKPTYEDLLGVSAHQLKHGKWPMSDHNCRQVCSKEYPPDHYVPFQSVTVPNMTSAIKAFVRWKTGQSKELAITNWTSVASLLNVSGRFAAYL